jgi:hypothetical protein
MNSVGVDQYASSVPGICRRFALTGLSVGVTYMVAATFRNFMSNGYEYAVYLYRDATSQVANRFSEGGVAFGVGQERGFFIATASSHYIFACSGGQYSGAVLGDVREDEWVVIPTVVAGGPCP